jgi:hypothetical protein
MKEIEPPAATEVNGGLTPRQSEDLVYTDPLAVKSPLVEIDYNPQPLPQ